MAAEKKKDGAIDLSMSDDDNDSGSPVTPTQRLDEDDHEGSDDGKDMKDEDKKDESDFDEEGEEFAQGSFR